MNNESFSYRFFTVFNLHGKYFPILFTAPVLRERLFWQHQIINSITDKKMLNKSATQIGSEIDFPSTIN